MMQRNIRTAREEDLPRILEIYAYARDFMEKTGNPNQWGNHHPPKHQLQQDIQDGNLFVVTEEEKIHGVFFFSIGEDPTYREIFCGS